MKLRKILALLMCLTFAAAVLTGCGGEEPMPESTSESVYEAEDQSADLEGMYFSDGVLMAEFADGVCVITSTDDGSVTEQGAYTWDGMVGDIDGEYGYIIFTIEDGVLVLEAEDESIYTLPAVESTGEEEDNISLIQACTWGLDELQYTFMPDGVLHAYNSYNDMALDGSYTWNPKTMSGVVTIDGGDQRFCYRDDHVVMIDDVDHEYHLSPVDPAAAQDGLDADGLSKDEFVNESFYYESVELTFVDAERAVFCMAGEEDFMIGHFDFDENTGDGVIHVEGAEIRFAWDGEDMFLYSDDGEEFWMDEEPDPEYFPDLAE